MSGRSVKVFDLNRKLSFFREEKGFDPRGILLALIPRGEPYVQTPWAMFGIQLSVKRVVKLEGFYFTFKVTDHAEALTDDRETAFDSIDTEIEFIYKSI